MKAVEAALSAGTLPGVAVATPGAATERSPVPAAKASPAPRSPVPAKPAAAPRSQHDGRTNNDTGF